MRFFDLVSFHDHEMGSLAARLGYKRVLEVGKDVEVVEKVGEPDGRKKILVTDSFENVTKALRQAEFLGVSPKFAALGAKTLDAVGKAESMVVLPLAKVTCAGSGARTHELLRVRGWVKNTLAAKVPLALVSLAENREGMMSSLQMLELAGFLGVPAEKAKEALSALGGLV